MRILCESLILPLIGTAIGAACVFFLKDCGSGAVRVSAAERLMIGFSAGLMTSASFFSLLMPAVESENGFKISIFGFLFGIFLLSLIDRLIRSAAEKRQFSAGWDRAMLGFLAVLLHNIPEGMAVGAVAAGFFAGQNHSAEVFALTFGIAVQNVPDGAIVSLPFLAGGMSKKRAFFFGILSGAVEPVAAFLTCLLAGAVGGFLPFFLSFAAAAMLYVVVRELVPEMEAEGKTGMPAFTLGFILLMLLDRWFSG